ncbi:MAG: FGGY family carbohydrate kinase [Nitrososphaerota archaeon]
MNNVHVVPNLFIGIDVGTSSTKAILVDSQGKSLATSRQEYPMYRPYPGWAENNPDDWVRAVENCIHTLIRNSQVESTNIKGLCIVAQRDPVVLLDEHYRVLAPSISWTDRRDLKETFQVYDEFGQEKLIKTTGLIPVPGLTLPNVYWVRRHKPEIWKKTHKILSTKDYILFRLTGKIATDVSTPSRSMLYSIKRKEWAEWICEKAQIDVGLLPPISYQPWDIWEELSKSSATRLGLQPGTILAAGGGDDPAAVLGAGAIIVGDIVIGTGTAACLRVITNKTEPDLKGLADLSPHVIPNLFIYEFVIAGTGTSLRWFKTNFGDRITGEGVTYEKLLDEASQIPPGSNGLFFYPYIEGARAPYYNANATGVFFGIQAHHTYAHFVRSIIEGIAFQYPPTLKLVLQYSKKRPNSLIIVDDEAKNLLWNQLKSDVLGMKIKTPKILYAAAMGAAILAALASKVYTNPSLAVQQMIKYDNEYYPELTKHKIYNTIRKKYEQIYRIIEKAYQIDETQHIYK